MNGKAVSWEWWRAGLGLGRVNGCDCEVEVKEECVDGGDSCWWGW